jgi:cellulose synthase/poly-beta-1,6-N-acetylglucosamine synthase-like glycosyltransferase
MPAIVAAVVFWTSATMVLYTYIAYPLLIWICARSSRRTVTAPHPTDADLPDVTLLIIAYNEELIIRSRLENALNLDYPPGKLQIVLASDGSSDATAQISRAFADRGVVTLDYPERRGKASTLNAAFAELKSSIVVLSDANTYTDRPAVRALVRWFDLPQVGVVCGRLVLTDPVTGLNVDGLYWKYETFLKRCEGKLGALLGANGGIYAVRRKFFSPIHSDTIVDDFVLPLLGKLRYGYRIVYDIDAVAHEETAPDLESEFGRRCRIGAGGFQSIQILWRLLDPRRGWIALTFFSHKVVRWLCPFFLAAMLASNALLLDRPLYRLTFAAQIALYIASALGGIFSGTGTALRLLRLTTMFTTMNIALLVGFWRWMLGQQRGTWNRTAR